MKENKHHIINYILHSLTRNTYLNYTTIYYSSLYDKEYYLFGTTSDLRISGEMIEIPRVDDYDEDDEYYYRDVGYSFDNSQFFYYLDDFIEFLLKLIESKNIILDTEYCYLILKIYQKEWINNLLVRMINFNTLNDII